MDCTCLGAPPDSLNSVSIQPSTRRTQAACGWRVRNGDSACGAGIGPSSREATPMHLGRHFPLYYRSPCCIISAGMAAWRGTITREYEQYLRKRRSENAPDAFQGGWVANGILGCRLADDPSTDGRRFVGDFSHVEVAVEFEDFSKTQSTWQSLRDVAAIAGLSSKCRRSAASIGTVLIAVFLQGGSAIHGEAPQGPRLQEARD